MGVLVFKAPKGAVVDRVVKMVRKFVDGFMEFADVGFRYIYVPGDEEALKSKKG